MKKWIKKHKRLVGTIILPIILFILGLFFGRQSCEIMGDNNGIFTTTNNGNITQNNIKELSPIEIENKKYREENKTKIIGFFRYWNDEKIKEARNNIDADISWIFTQEKMEYFYKDMTDFFEINTERRGDIANSDFYISTKFDVLITYKYLNTIYEHSLLVVVGRDKNDMKQHHITQMRCEEGNGPLCDFLLGN